MELCIKLVYLYHSETALCDLYQSTSKISCKPVFGGGGEIAKGGRGRGARSLAGEGEIASDFAPGGRDR